MAKVISEYVKDYNAVREYRETGSGSLGEYTQDEETILNGFNYFEKLYVEVGYRLVFIRQGKESNMYFSNIADLSDKLYSLIVEYKHQRDDTSPPPTGIGADNVRWDPVTGKGE